MDPKILKIVAASVALTVVLASAICAYIFNTTFAKSTIDYFSFAFALFLIADGSFKISRYRNEPYFFNQFVRHIRILVGTCIFTIHVMQFIYGI